MDQMLRAISPTWYKATDIKERIAALRQSGRIDELKGWDVALARRRLQAWREQRPFGSAEVFATRLASSGLTEEDFLLILGADDEQTKKFFLATPDWLFNLFKLIDVDLSLSEVPFLVGESVDPFLCLIRPYLVHAFQGIKNFADGLSHDKALPFDPATIGSLIAVHLPTRLRWMCTQTLVLEIFIARRGGLLQGQSPEDRYQSLGKLFEDTGLLLELWERYPVLSRLLMERTDNWLAAKLEFLRRLNQDWECLCHTFQIGDKGKLAEIREGLGDSHNCGRSVSILTFSSGAKIVYKPRPMSVGLHFQDILGWLNDHNQSPPFRTLQILDCGEYGWSEYVEANPCASLEELDRFYRRQGSYLALFHALGGCDLHNENLIAVGEHPMIVDLETIMAPVLNHGNRGVIEEFAGDIMRSTALMVGLIPLAKDGDTFDGSGLGSQEGQLTPTKIPHVERAGTDEMWINRCRLSLPPQKNSPSLLGERVRLYDYRDSIVAGFENTYNIIMGHSEEWTRDGGLLEKFSEDDIRVVIRPTRTYGALLQESYHPHLLQNALDRERHLDLLWVAAEEYPLLRALTPVEIDALKRGDIPIWSADAGSDVLKGDKQVEFGGCLKCSALDHARERIRGFGSNDLLRNKSVLSNLLKVSELNQGDDVFRRSVVAVSESSILRPRRGSTVDCSCDEFLREAIAAGRYLERMAFRESHSDGVQLASWPRIASRESKAWSLMFLSTDLYDGIAGISLFLAYLGLLTGESSFSGLARAGLNTIQAKLRSRLDTDDFSSLGAFSGLSGIVYLFCHLGHIWGEDSLIREANNLVKHIDQRISLDEKFDIISGVAGCIPCLLNLYNLSGYSPALSVALRCGEHLVANASEVGPGVAWSTSVASEPLAGFSHGVAGIAWALTELASASGRQEFSDLALKSLEYERTLYVAKHRNWRDLRGLENLHRGQVRDGAKFLWAWCHGAPGVGLGRFGILRHIPSPIVKQEAEVSLQSTMDSTSGLSQCLCHGDLGNIELLLQARRFLEKPELEEEIRQRSAGILEDIRSRGYVYGAVNGLESLGLMTGLAGIGYGLLRLAKPEQVPAVLLLEGPRA